MANLERFLEAQENDYQRAAEELKGGKKEFHWMWYIFPQFKGLGHSSVARYYEIQSKEEAMSYINHPILFPRLLELARILLQNPTSDAFSVMGYPDCLKLQSSLTLFYLLTKNDILEAVLQKYYQGELCSYTVRMLEEEGKQ